MVKSRVAKVARLEGRQRSDQEKGVVTGQIRRQLSTTCIRAASQCLLDRMHQCGEGGTMASRRREGNRQLELAMQGERERQFISRVRGPIVRRGQFFRQ